MSVVAPAEVLAAVERFNQAFADRDIDAIMAAMTADCLFEDTTPPDGIRHAGTAAVRTAWRALFTAAPHGRFTSEDTMVAGDRVISSWRYDFDATDPGAGHVRGVDLFTIRDGLVAEKRAYVKG